MAFCVLHYYSDALKKQTAVNVLLPDPSIPGPYAVMLLLHGLSDDHTCWTRWSSIERHVEGWPLIVAMPDGGRSFYCDAEEGYAYGTAIGTELPELLKAYFPTSGKWCVSGLSMGGYGAIKLALRHPNRFVSGHSMSGALGFAHSRDFAESAGDAEFRRIVGGKPRGGPHDLHALSASLKAPRPNLLIDCGVEDFLIDDNRAFHGHLQSLGIEHEYQEYPGAHTWAYWDEHVQEGLAFHARNLGLAQRQNS